MCTIGIALHCNTIIVENLVVKGDSGVILSNINLKISGSGIIQVIGPNGAGKTTLLKAILGLIKLQKGYIRVCNVDPYKDTKKIHRLVGYVPQEQPLLPGIPITAWEFLEYTLSFKEEKKALLGTTSKKDYIEELMNRVGLDRSYWYKPLNQLSSGEKQRLYIARALIGDPPILLMDEPLSSVDPRGRHEIIELLGSLSQEKMLVVTSHDPFFLIKYTNYVVALNKKVVAQGPPDKVLRKEQLVEVYGEKALSLVRYSHICDLH